MKSYKNLEDFFFDNCSVEWTQLKETFSDFHFSNWFRTNSIKLGDLIKIDNIIYQIKLFGDITNNTSIDPSTSSYTCLIPV